MSKEAKSRAEQTRDRPDAGRISQLAAAATFVDKRPEAVAQGKLIDAIHDSPRMLAQRQQLRNMFGDAVQLKGGPEDDELLQGKWATIQRQGPADEELQMKAAGSPLAQLQPEPPAPGNSTGLPDKLKSGIEALSGISMDNVNVHYNSPQPAQLNALAYAQGSDIHIAPGQEQHLPHEAWHLVQQAQGRVRPTMQMKDGVPVNDDKGLVHEADVMGALPVRMNKGMLDARQAPRGAPPLDRMAHTRGGDATSYGQRSNARLPAQSVERQRALGAVVVQRRLTNKEHDDLLVENAPKLSLEAMEAHTKKSVQTLTVRKELEGTGATGSAALTPYLDENSVSMDTEFWPVYGEQVSFENAFSGHVWIMKNNFKEEDILGFHANQAQQWQANEAGFPDPPEVIVRKNVVNVKARDKLSTVLATPENERKSGVTIEAPTFKTFINDTDNGKNTMRILKEHGLRPSSAQVFGTNLSPTIVINAEEGVWDPKAGNAEMLMQDLTEVPTEVPTEGMTEVSNPPAPKGNTRNTKCCYLTTACVTARGLADDCDELQALRRFRDGWLRALPGGAALIEDYYRTAPMILGHIYALPNAKAVLDALYETVIVPCVAAIHAGDNERAFVMYCGAVRCLQDELSGFSIEDWSEVHDL